MTVNPLPPQAYTKDTLQKAYAWLLNQSPSLKDMATTQDMLVSLYLKAQRNGEASLETPSIQNFKKELKNLASMIGDLQTPTPVTAVHTPAPPASPSTQNRSLFGAGITQSIKETFIETPSRTPSDNSSGSNSSLGQLDLQSLQILAEVRQSLNLSSDIEALRVLITLGYKQIKKMN